jgi:hypothetical protein
MCRNARPVALKNFSAERLHFTLKNEVEPRLLKAQV